METIILFFYMANGVIIGAIAYKLTKMVKEKVYYHDKEAEMFAAKVARNVAFLWNAVLLALLLYVVFQIHTHGGIDISIRIKNYKNEIPKVEKTKTPTSVVAD